jgi:ATP/maltotriose-dependent transcriptional regulator MalT
MGEGSDTGVTAGTSTPKAVVRSRKRRTPKPVLAADALAPAKVVLRSKLAAPAFRPGHLGRPVLVERLRTLLSGRLTLIAAPAGFGKTTLLAEWLAETPGAKVAWVSLDEGDNDPLRLWSHIVAALRRVVPAMRRSDTLDSAVGSTNVVPSVLNLLGAAEVTLVLDDYHFITAARCHESLALFVKHLPANVHLVLSSRREPPLPLGRLRATGELGEIRADELRFDLAETRALLVDSLELELSDLDVERLHEKTEGWPAALYLAALSLRDAGDARAFVERFAGSNRHVADYVTSEVLSATDTQTRDFLLRTSVLDELSGPLCDAVLETDHSSERLHELERSNLFVAPLDDTRVRYRYHPLLRGLLRFELDDRAPELASGLHERASAWFEAAGDAQHAVEHAVESRNTTLAGRLVMRYWGEVAGRHGRVRPVLGWLEALPPSLVEREPALALVRALLESQLGSPPDGVESLLAVAEDREGAQYTLPLPLGTDSPRLEAAIVRATLGSDDVGKSLSAARVTVDLARSAGPQARAVAGTAFAYWLLLAGREHEAFPAAKQALHAPMSASWPLLWATQHAIASLAAAALGDDVVADVFAERAVSVVEQTRHTETPRAALVWIARGAMFARCGSPDEAVATLHQAASLARAPALALERTLALVMLAGVPNRGDALPVDGELEEARAIVEAAADPGVLGVLLSAGTVRPASRRRVDQDEISDAELRVLRLLPTRLTQREIGRELYLSFNTVKTHTRALYRKLGVAARREAVTRARELRLI